jgi:hypothetical protein
MMNDCDPVLYAFKYKAIKLGCQYSPSHLKNVAWNIRKKYIRHTSEPEAEQALRNFSDAAIDDQNIDYENLYHANEALLQAQRWRYDSENFSIDPPNRNEWKAFEDSVTSVTVHDSLGVSILNSKFPNFDFPDANDIREIYFKVAVIDLISKVSKIDDPRLGNIDYILNNSPQRIFEDVFSEVKELSFIDCEDAQSIVEALGFGASYAKATFSTSNAVGESEPARKLFVVEAPLNTEKLYIVEESIAGTKVIMNENHALVKHFGSNNRDDIELIVMSLAESEAHFFNDSRFTSRFISYFSTKLSEHLLDN